MLANRLDPPPACRRISRPTLLLVTALSLALNFFLGARLIREWTPSSQLASTGATRPPTRAADGSAPLPFSFTRPSFERAVPHPGGAHPPPFLWADIESDDYPTYIANLRAIGCPETLIQDLVAADLVQVQRQRFEAVWQPKPVPYWRPNSDREEPDDETRRRLEAARLPISGILTELFGIPISDWEFGGLLDGTMIEVEENLMFLEPHRREEVLDRLRLSGHLAREYVISAPDAALEDFSDVLPERHRQLTAWLTPEEAEEYQLRHGQNAMKLRYRLGGFEPTPDEFVALVRAWEAAPPHPTGPSTGSPTEQAARMAQWVSGVLGPSRAAEFERHPSSSGFRAP